MAKRIYFYAFLFSVWALSISGVFGNSGVLQAYRLAEVKRDLSLKITALENEEVRLRSQLHLLETNSFAQEAVIRDGLSWARPNELVFEFK